MAEPTIPGPQGGPLGGGGPEIPGGFSQGPFHGPPEWVSYNVPPELRLGMTDVQQNGTSRGGVPLYQGTDQYGREWLWSARGPIGYRDDEDGIWHEVSEQDGIWHDRWTDQNGWERHSTQDAQGNHLSTTSSHPDIPLSPQDAFTDAIKDDVFAEPPPPPYQEAPPDAFKDKAVEPPSPDGDIQVRLPDAFKDNAVEPPPPWSYGDIQVRPPDAFKDKAVEPPPYQEPPPEEPPVAEPPPPLGAEGGEEEQLPPPVTQTPEAEPPVQPTPPPPSPDGGTQVQERPPDAFKDKAVEPPPFIGPKARAEQSLRPDPPNEPPPPPPYDPATGIPQPDGDGDGIPNEYGDGPDLDGNGVPDEIGINPDNQQPGYPSGEGLPNGDGDGIPNEYGDGPDLDGNGVPDEIGINPDNQQLGYPGGLPDGNANGIPGEYGDGPDLDANGIPDEVGINPDSLQPGYPNPSTSVDWGGVGVPDPTVVPQSGTTTTGAEAMPEGYGDGSAPDGNWVPEETAIDPYVPPEEVPLEEEAPVAEGEEPNALGSF